MRSKWWGKDRLWVCSGGFHDPDGICLDIREEVEPDIVGNAEVLPFKDQSFDFVMADPPYSESEARDLYNLPYLKMTVLIEEMYRVCKDNGLIIILHRLIPGARPNCSLSLCSCEGVVGIGTISAWCNIRALTVWRKRVPLVQWDMGWSE